jgi:hypothetical protein
LKGNKSIQIKEVYREIAWLFNEIKSNDGRGSKFPCFLSNPEVTYWSGR